MKRGKNTTFNVLHHLDLDRYSGKVLGARQIRILTSYPLKNVLSVPEVFDRLAHISIELDKYDIKFQPCTTIKAYAIESFVAKPIEHTSLHLKRASRSGICILELKDKVVWKVYANGSSNFKRVGIGVLIWDNEKGIYEYSEE